MWPVIITVTVLVLIAIFYHYSQEYAEAKRIEKTIKSMQRDEKIVRITLPDDYNPQSNYRSDFFKNMYKSCDFAAVLGDPKYVEYMIYMTYKANLIASFEITQLSISDTQKEQLLINYNNNQYNALLEWLSDNTNVDNLAVIISSRFDAYEKIFYKYVNMEFSKMFVMSYISDTLYWFLENGWDSYYRNPNLLFNVSDIKGVNSNNSDEKLVLIHDQLEFFLLDYCDKHTNNYINQILQG